MKPRTYNAETYAKAREMWLKVHQEQIEKGEAKYPEPLNHENWTMEQLIHHAMQENIDQFHYLTAMLIKEREKGGTNVENNKDIARF